LERKKETIDHHLFVGSILLDCDSLLQGHSKPLHAHATRSCNRVADKLAE